MNGGPVPVEVTGTVQRIDTTGIDPNSGEVTIVIMPDGGGTVVEVFLAILEY
jgi:hypothetical protein